MRGGNDPDSIEYLAMIPCPFCGADGDGLSVQVDRCVDTDESYAWVECGSCEASGPVAETLAEDLDNPEELAIKAWNERKVKA